MNREVDREEARRTMNEASQYLIDLVAAAPDQMCDMADWVRDQEHWYTLQLLSALLVPGPIYLIAEFLKAAAAELDSDWPEDMVIPKVDKENFDPAFIEQVQKVTDTLSAGTMTAFSMAEMILDTKSRVPENTLPPSRSSDDTMAYLNNALGKALDELLS